VNQTGSITELNKVLNVGLTAVSQTVLLPKMLFSENLLSCMKCAV